MKRNNLSLISDSLCPYCNIILDKKPTRNKKCPNCKQQIMVREKLLMTEKQADDHDEAIIQEHRKQLENSSRNSLINYKQSGVVEYIKILTAGQNSCEACRALNRKKFLLEDALNNPPLPVKNCTSVYGYCRCCYTPVVKKEFRI